MSFGTILYTILISPLQMFFEFIFSFAQRFTSNPGFSIIVLSLVMNFLVLPLYKRADAMQAEERDTEAKLHDGIAHIKKVFSGDERMMMQQEYYRQNHYKPADAFKGSVSLFLEIPFFIAAYQFLSHLQTLQGVSFGPIADLGVQDGLITINGMSINLLPILMTAVNLISCIIYTKGFPLKTKVQLYAMAIFFFFFLYDSPAGLLFYWTLNNVFSLVKNIFYKLKNPDKVLAVLSSATGAVLIIYALMSSHTTTDKLVIALIGAALQIPLLLNFIKKKKTEEKKTAEPNKKMFLLSALLLAVILGVLIPSSVIKASPQEFVDITNYHHPLWYVVSAFSLSFGTCLIWFGVFYWLARKKGKVLFEKIMWILCGAVIVNYMFFGTDLGNMSSALIYDNDFEFSKTQMIYNLGILVILCIVMSVTFKRYKKFTIGALATGIIAVSGLSVMYMKDIYDATIGLKDTAIKTAESTPHFTLSKTGKNVIVFMLDRSIGQYMPYIFNEKPELAEQFSGFTYYSNTVSFGKCTNTGSPALFGGYEYTPAEIDKRSDEALVEKQNEALKVMPVLFEQNGYDVTVCDAPYANYQWIPDLSIYDDYPDIHTYLTSGKFNGVVVSASQLFETDQRNFFCYSIMKTSPLALQHFLYNNGNYFKQNKYDSSASTTETDTPEEVAGTAAMQGFLNEYNVLKNLPNITEVTDDNTNSFLMMNNDITHMDLILKEPEYVASNDVDNTEYDAEHVDRFTVDGKTINMDAPRAYAHYEVNMAAMIQMGKWFDYMKANGVYDNTRIILVADHGFPLGQYQSLITTSSTGEEEDLNGFFPLLMMKDFNATEFTTSTEFMTNGDVPTLATSDVIENAVNPFTGKAITNTEKTAHKQYLFASTDWDATTNNGNVFTPADWYSVENDAWDINNWKLEAGNSTSPTN